MFEVQTKFLVGSVLEEHHPLPPLHYCYLHHLLLSLNVRPELLPLLQLLAAAVQLLLQHLDLLQQILHNKVRGER